MTSSSLFLATSGFIFFLAFFVPSSSSANLHLILNNEFTSCLVYTGSPLTLPSRITLKKSCATSTTSAKVWTKTLLSTGNLMFCASSNVNLCLAVGTGNKLYLMAKNSTNNNQLFSLSNKNLLKTVATGTSKCAKVQYSDGYIEMVTCALTTDTSYRWQTFFLVA